MEPQIIFSEIIEHAGFAVQTVFISMLLCVSRIFGFFEIIAMFNKVIFPSLPRKIFIFVIASIIFPVVYQDLSNHTDYTIFWILGITLKELIVGLLLAFPFAILLWSIEGIGVLIDTQRGASIGAIGGPFGEAETQPTGALLLFTFVCFLFVSGGFQMMLDVIYKSYITWPIFSYTPIFSITALEIITEISGNILKLMLILAGPIIVSMFLAELTLIYGARVAPQMNVFVLAMPIKCGIAMLFLVFYFHILFNILSTYMWNTLYSMKHFLSIFQ